MGWGDSLVSVKYKHESMNLIPRAQVKKLGIMVGVFHPSTGSRDKQIPGTHWSDSLAYIASSGPVKDPVPESKVDRTLLQKR